MTVKPYIKNQLKNLSFDKLKNVFVHCGETNDIELIEYIINEQELYKKLMLNSYCKDSIVFSCLMKALLNENQKVADYILDSNDKISLDLSANEYENFNTLIMHLANEGSIEQIEYMREKLLEQNKNFVFPLYSYTYGLHTYIRTDLELAKKMLSEEKWLNAINLDEDIHHGYTLQDIFEYAANYKQIEVIDILLSSEKTKTYLDPYNVLDKTRYLQDATVAEYLIFDYKIPYNEQAKQICAKKSAEKINLWFEKREFNKSLEDNLQNKAVSKRNKL